MHAEYIYRKKILKHKIPNINTLSYEGCNNSLATKRVTLEMQ